MIKDNIKIVHENMKNSINNARVKLEEPLKLIAVTKNHPVQAMLEAIEAGVTIVGENRVQEAQEKFKVVGNSVSWHLIGHLQRNKVKHAIPIFDLIHSVDNLKLAQEISKVAMQNDKIQNILVQVNLVNEESKFGVDVDNLSELLLNIDKLPNILIQGLMFIAPNLDNKEEVRPLFRKMYQIFMEMGNLSLLHKDWRYLSMGMTNDYEIAIEEGANLIRVGTGIFGARAY